MHNTLVIHYSDIGTKGENRGFFENQLLNNISRVLDKNIIKIYKRYGRIICDLSDKTDFEKTKQLLEKIPGIATFSFAVKSDLDIDIIKKTSIEILKDKEFSTFRVTSRRSNKSFRYDSKQINNIIGEHVSKNLKKKVSLKNYDLELFIEICEKEVFIYCEKNKGIGGLPVSTSGKVICSLSGGIDSPVAAFLMMKRGCKVVFAHIYNKTMGKEGVMSKINKIAEHFTEFQLNSKLYIVPFEDIQKEIIMHVPSKYRMIVYRRFMMKILNKIAKTEKANGIVTGDSVGQVASQTLENINCIYNASELPVLAPLTGLNKEEIIQIARKIGTFDYSIMPYPDCCSFMIAQHPETRADLNEIIKIEKAVKNQEKLIDKSISKANVKVFKLD